jgi:hypothetical protein
MMKSLLGALCLCLILILMACRSTVQEASVIIEGAEAEKIMLQVGAALAGAKPSSEDEGLVLNHLQNLWHYVRVSRSTNITVTRKSWIRGGKHIESISAVYDGGPFGIITINTQDNDASVANGIEEGTIKFSEQVDTPEKGTGHGAMYPFGKKLGNQEVPPSFQLELPGGYYVPADGLRDPRKRFMKHQNSIDLLQALCQDTADLGLRVVVFEKE